MKPTAVLSSLWLAGCSVFGINGVKEPPYRLVARFGTTEIRRYDPRIVAETAVHAGELDARSIGFRRIAGYIFGANHGGAKIAMTAPVAQSAGETIAMTAPVVQARDAAGTWRIRFFMPAEYTLQMLPQPNDPAVRLLQLPAETYAVRRFSGVPSPASVGRQTGILLHDLAGSLWAPSGTPVAWFYDPPWTLPPLRRNEVAVVVADR